MLSPGNVNIYKSSISTINTNIQNKKNNQTIINKGIETPKIIKNRDFQGFSYSIKALPEACKLLFHRNGLNFKVTLHIFSSD